MPRQVQAQRKIIVIPRITPQTFSRNSWSIHPCTSLYGQNVPMFRHLWVEKENGGIISVKPWKSSLAVSPTWTRFWQECSNIMWSQWYNKLRCFDRKGKLCLLLMTSSSKWELCVNLWRRLFVREMVCGRPCDFDMCRHAKRTCFFPCWRWEVLSLSGDLKMAIS